MHTSTLHSIWLMKITSMCESGVPKWYFSQYIHLFTGNHMSGNNTSFMYTEFWIADYSVTFLLGITWRILIDHRLLKTFFSMAIEKWKIGVPSQQWVNSNWIMIYGSRCERKCVKLYKPNKGYFFLSFFVQNNEKELCYIKKRNQ